MQRALTILLALALDLAFGDPPNRFHPVVLMGRWLSWGRRLAPQQHRFWFGAGWIVAGLALFTLPWLKRATSNEQLTMNNEQLTMNNPPTLQPSILPSFHPSLLPSLLLKPIFAYRNLRRSVNEVAEALAADNLPEARRLLSWHLVSRDTSELTAEEVAGAAIESLAENLTDSLAAPLLAYAIGGLPAAWGYRFVNTADAMWGYRTAEFEALGKFAARLDDALNWLPARLTGWLLVAAAALSGADARRAARVMLGQHTRTASPNAGWTMSAMAGALNITLTKRGVYELSGGPDPVQVATIRRAIRLADRCVGLTAGLCLAIAARRRGSI
ncbi:MAG TPA: adenosylcobinamide-phosphate synthase CbiB [Anaerolineae bacterium]|nr:adenosylcobinamide-phosphate synthase CbiB [Anaerolineae bacterium]